AHRGDLARVEQGLLDLVRIPGVRFADQVRDQEYAGGGVVALEQRPRDLVRGAVPVVEREDDGPPRQGALAAPVGEPVGERNRLVAPATQRGELGVELLGEHVVAEVARARRGGRPSRSHAVARRPRACSSWAPQRAYTIIFSRWWVRSRYGTCRSGAPRSPTSGTASRRSCTRSSEKRRPRRNNRTCQSRPQRPRLRSRPRK